MESSSDKPSDHEIDQAAQALARLLAEAILGEHANQINERGRELHRHLFGLASIRYDALLADMEKHFPGCTCGGPICADTNLVIQNFFEEVRFIREIIEPHKPRILEMMKRHKADRKRLEGLAELHNIR